MKITLPAAIAAIAVSTAFVARAQDVPKETKDKVSYSIGLDIGKNIGRQGIEVNTDQLLSGLKDGLSGAAPKLSEEDMANTMQTLMAEIQKKRPAIQGRERRQRRQAQGHRHGFRALHRHIDQRQEIRQLPRS
jgi:hypothetical protein